MATAKTHDMLAVLADRVRGRAKMTERNLVHTVSTFDASKAELTFDAALRRVGTWLLVLLILAAVWFSATELLVLALRNGWSFGPRFS
jgi:hypothetical protein